MRDAWTQSWHRLERTDPRARQKRLLGGAWLFLFRGMTPMQPLIHPIEITREDSETKGRYVAKIPGVDGEGELTFSKASSTLIIVDHTTVADAMRGMGIAAALAKRVIADARQAGQKIVPLCPFLRGYVERHKEETADVIR